MTSVLKVDTIQNSTGTDALSISSTGSLYPKGLTYLPVASVSLSTSNTQDSSNPFTATGVPIKFDKIWVNEGNVYDASTGIFTAPVDGIYEFTGDFLKSSGSVVTYWYIYKNGTNFASGGYSAQSGYASLSGNIVLELVSGDELSVYLGGGELNINPVTSSLWNNVTFRYLG